MWRFNLIVAVAVSVVPGCSSGPGDANAPGKRREPTSSSAASRSDLRSGQWLCTIVDGFEPTAETAKIPKSKLKRIRSPMTLRELTDLLGPGWVSRYEGCGIITWTGEDGLRLEVWPTTSRPEEVIDVGPRGMGGSGGRGRMWIYRVQQGGEIQDLSIPLK